MQKFYESKLLKERRIKKCQHMCWVRCFQRMTVRMMAGIFYTIFFENCCMSLIKLSYIASLRMGRKSQTFVDFNPGHLNLEQGWYFYFLLKIKVNIILRKTKARLSLKIDLGLCISTQESKSIIKFKNLSIFHCLKYTQYQFLKLVLNM